MSKFPIDRVSIQERHDFHFKQYLQYKYTNVITYVTSECKRK